VPVLDLPRNPFRISVVPRPGQEVIIWDDPAQPRTYWDVAPFSLGDDVTAILSWEEDGDMLIAADGLGWSETGNHHQTELKTARINDHSVIAARGDTYYANQVLCHLFNVYDRACGHEPWIHLIEELEKQQIYRPDLDLHGIISIVDGCCASIVGRIDAARTQGRRFIPFDVDFVVFSSFDGRFKIHGWRGPAWKVELVNDRPLLLIPVSTKKERVAKLIQRSDIAPERRVLRAMKVVASRSDRVNENATLRRASQQFRLERLFEAVRSGGG